MRLEDENQYESGSGSRRGVSPTFLAELAKYALIALFTDYAST